MSKTNAPVRVLIVDDNLAIHQDFLKILQIPELTELQKLENELFDEMSNAKVMSTKAAMLMPELKIDLASQGLEAVQFVAQSIQEHYPYAVAFVDIRMPPGWDGIKTISEIWKIDQHIQVVICTAYSDYSWEKTISALGAKDNLLILKKPFDAITIRQLVYALAHKWQLAMRVRQYTEELEHRIAERTNELQFQATHDSLTKLPNRRLLISRIKQAIPQNLAEKRHIFALFFIDLDRFKIINDSMSHTVGDELLNQVAQRLAALLPSTDTLARFGGDEFVAVINSINTEYDAQIMANRVLDAFKKPFNIFGYTLNITASIGISLYPRDSADIDTLIRDADVAMYAAKKRGANHFEFYSKQHDKNSFTKLEFEMDLRKALTSNEFRLEYQPQINLITGEFDGVEALVRWEHPTRGLIQPNDFIPLAEDTNMILTIGEWVLRSACQQNKLWQEQGFPKLRVSVNVAPQQFEEGNIIDVVAQVLHETKLDPTYLELEITENLILRRQDVIDTITSLKALGVHLALDDFGAGYSSLAYLKKLPIDRIKIDQSYIENIASSKSDEEIIKAIISLANSLQLQVLAEGVETLEQLNFLRKRYCTQIQGDYFSNPMPPDKVMKFIMQYISEQRRPGWPPIDEKAPDEVK